MKLLRLLSLILAIVLLMTACGAEPSDKTSGGTAAPGSQENAEDHLVQDGSTYTLYSPDNTLAISIATEGQMSYWVEQIRDGNTIQWVRPSVLGVTVADQTFYKDATVTSADVTEITVNYPLYGNRRNVEGHCMEAVFTLSQDGVAADGGYRLEVRVYNNGVAFRYCIPETENPSGLEELTTYALRTDLSQCWYGITGVNTQDYELDIAAFSPDRRGGEVITAPLTAVVASDGGYLSLMEAALNETYPGVNLKAEGDATFSTCFYTKPTLSKGPMITGWRLINIADDLNGLVNNYNIYTVNEGAGELFADTSWIQPGRSTWSWNTTHSAPTYEQMQEYTIAAALLGYEYNIIDDGWPGWKNYKEQLTDLGVMGEKLNVKQLLWGAITQGTVGYNRFSNKASADDYLQLLSDTHMYGAKVDFWWSESDTNTTDLQKYILEEAAKRQFIIDFHGCNKNTGLNITYPNELSREAILGLEHIGNSNTTDYTTYARRLNAQLYTRYLCGHADFTPATYNAMEIASLILIDSPLMVVATDAADILASPAAEFIKSIPSVWDQTVVLPVSRIGEYSVYAKENCGTWFVGGIASSRQGDAKVTLSDFLPAGTYTAEIWVDVKNSMEQRILTVTEQDEIDIGLLNPGRGFAIRISKLSLSQYGGAIGTIAVSAPEGANVKYTIDGSDPFSSPTAVLCDGSITLPASCRLQVAIVEGDGAGTMLSYQFNKIALEYTFTPSVEYQDGKTLVTFDPNDASVKIYYTMDGSVPTTASALADKTVTVLDTCTLRYLVVTHEGSFEGSIPVRVRATLKAPVSDLALTDANPISTPQVGWGTAHYDTSMASDNEIPAQKISLGGTTLYDGTFFDRGISSNANSVYTYAVPDGYTRFVGIVGIDSSVYSNLEECAKASARLILSFDGMTVYTSDMFRMGEYVYFDVEIPFGAAKLTIRFDDAGNGDVCDNVSLAAPGWVR